MTTRPFGQHSPQVGSGHFGWPHPLQVLDDEAVLRAATSLAPFWAPGVDDLARRAGGLDRLLTLDDDQLPDEQFDVAPVPAQSRQRAEAIVAACVAALGASRPARPTTFSVDAAMRVVPQSTIDEEHRTIIGRLLVLLANRAPALLERSSPERMGAALTWVTLRANRWRDAKRGCEAGDIWRLFGVSDCSKLGRDVHRSLGLPKGDIPEGRGRRGDIWLADPRLLHSTVRRALIEERRSLTSCIRDVQRRRDEVRQIRITERGEVVMAGRPIVPRWAMRTKPTNGRSAVMLVVGDDPDEPQVFALSVPDAHALIAMVTAALNTLGCPCSVAQP